ncbi:MAG: hypothetical protein M1834_005934 [Cirrosporium novae-zelandiae]|nr:MAG: hypothetical protein M1834_005934 [Cirrosporium novae-zelandiae]
MLDNNQITPPWANEAGTVEEQGLLLEPDGYVSDDGAIQITQPNNKPLPKSPKRWRSRLTLCLWAIALTSIVIFGVTLGGRRSHRRKHFDFESIHNNGQSRLPTSKNYRLNFPEQYPPLDPNHSSKECRDAWATLDSITCHEQIWARNWDNGGIQLLGPSLSRFLPMICKHYCTNELRQAQELLHQFCGQDDKFLLDNYKGRFNTTMLEPNPAAVLDTLNARQIQSCRTSPIDDAERGYCMTDLQERWYFIDGLETDGLGGIDDFLDRSNEHKVEPATRKSGVEGGKDWSNRYNYFREERRFGPGKGETTCSWCTFNWLERKLNSWKVDNTLGENGEPLELASFLSRIQKAGQRCAGDNFTRTWEKTVANYYEQGLLNDDIGTKLPSGDVVYLIGHGPSPGDYPLPAVKESIDSLAIQKTSENQAEIERYTNCLNSFYEEAQPLTCYPFLTFSDITRDILIDQARTKTFCSSHCSSSINDMRRSMITAGCNTNMNWESMSKMPEKYNLPFNLDTVFSELGTVETHSLVCQTERSSGTVCAYIWNTLGHPEWTLHEPSISQLLDVIEEALDNLPPIPQNVTEAIGVEWRQLTRDQRLLVQEWDNQMRAGVFSSCVWRKFARERTFMWGGDGDLIAQVKGVEDPDVLVRWIQTVHRYWDACKKRDVKHSEEEMKLVDKDIISRIGNNRFDEAMKIYRSTISTSTKSKDDGEREELA